MDIERTTGFRLAEEGYRWEGVALQPYKEDGNARFKDISRQVLFHEDSLACELRYFEMDAGGYSTLERHEHAHAVIIMRGHGECLVGDVVQAVKPLDLVSIPSWTWHQFRAADNEPLGFLCMVNVLRDRPELPTDDAIASMRSNPEVSRFLAGS